MSRKIKIALGHKARVGKDTAADFISGIVGAHWAEEVTVIRFAEVLYDLAVKVRGHVGLDPHEKDRDLLQLLGDWGRAIDPDIWIKTAMRRYDPNKHCIIVDMRTKAEARAAKEAGFVLVRINRPDETRIPLLDGKDPNHFTETDLDDYDGWDISINNSGTLDKYHDIWSKLLHNNYFTGGQA